MQTFTGENIISVERKYIDVPLSTITASALHAPVLSSRQSQPVQEMGTRLLELAKAGDAEGVRDLMNRGAPFSTDWLGTSPLHFAAQYNHLETVEMLLKAGISRDARNKVERTPLHVAAQEGNTDIVKLLISYGADVDSKDMLKMTPLHWAAENGQADCVRILLDFGADPLVLNKFDKTPQNIAHDNNRLDIVEMLQDAASLDPVSRKVLRAQGLEAAIENNVQIQNNLQQTNNNVNQPAVTHYEEVQTSSGAVIKIHKIVGRRKVNVPKQHQLQNSNVNLDYSQINETLSSDDLATTNLVNSLTSQGQQNQSSLQNTNSTLQMLQEHGITMLPVDDSSIVASAVQSGQTVVLTEAGKMALNLTKLNQPTQQTNNLFKKLPVTSKQVKTPQKILIDGRKLIRVQPEELINMTREKKVIIHTGDKKMGRPGQIIFSKPIRQVTNVGKLTDIQNKKVISSEITNKLKTDSQTSEVPRDKDLEEITKQLEEARRQAEMYKEKLLLKEKEAEQYKLQLESLVNGNSSCEGLTLDMT